MDGIGIATFALRLAAVYVWIQALLQVFLLSNLLAIVEHGGPPVNWTTYALTFLAQVLLGAALWFASRSLARRWFGSEQVLAPQGAADVGGLALRLLGVWLLDETLQRGSQLIFLVKAAGTGAFRSSLSAEVAGFAVLALAALILLVGGGRIARRWLPGGGRAGSVPASLQPIAFGVLGLAILASALPPLATDLVRSRWWSDESTTFGLMSSNSFSPHDATSLVRVLLGLALFLGSGPLARFWRWAHTAGLERGPAT